MQGPVIINWSPMPPRTPREAPLPKPQKIDFERRAAPTPQAIEFEPRTVLIFERPTPPRPILQFAPSAPPKAVLEFGPLGSNAATILEFAARGPKIVDVLDFDPRAPEIVNVLDFEPSPFLTEMRPFARMGTPRVLAPLPPPRFADNFIELPDEAARQVLAFPGLEIVQAPTVLEFAPKAPPIMSVLVFDPLPRITTIHEFPSPAPVKIVQREPVKIVQREPVRIVQREPDRPAPALPQAPPLPSVLVFDPLPRIATIHEFPSSTPVKIVQREPVKIAQAEPVQIVQTEPVKIVQTEPDRPAPALLPEVVRSSAFVVSWPPPATSPLRQLPARATFAVCTTPLTPSPQFVATVSFQRPYPIPNEPPRFDRAPRATDTPAYLPTQFFEPGGR